MTSPPPSAVMLSPGVRVVRRDAGHWQVGLHGPASLLVSTSPEHDRLLAALSGGAVSRPTDAVGGRLTRQLLDRGLLVEDSVMTRSVVAGSRQAHARSAVVAARGAQAPVVLDRRAATRVRVVADAPEHASLEILLTSAGLSLPDSADAPCEVAVLVALGEVPRASLDAWMRDSVPHLVVRAVDGRIVVGPFVTPGRSACLRCVDARRSESDPRHPLVVEQYAALAGRHRDDGVAEPVDPTLWALALASAAHDVVRFVDGHRPLAWSATRTFTADDDPEERAWPRHPRCGCAWGDGLATA